MVLQCSVRLGPEERSIRQEPTTRRREAAEGLLHAGPVRLCWAEHPSASGPGLPYKGYMRPCGHGAVAALRWQGLNQDPNVWGHKREEATLGGSLENISPAFEQFG